MATPIQTATKKASREGPAGRAIPEPEDYQELRRTLSYDELIQRARDCDSAAHAYHWYRAAKESIPLLDSEKRRMAHVSELRSLELHLHAHAYTATELVERFGHEEETAEETLLRVAVEVINELHSPMFTTYEENRARCINRLRALREYVDALGRSLKARRAATTIKEDKADKPLELTGQQLAMLNVLNEPRAAKGVSPHWLGEKMNKSYNAARSQVRRLVELGLAARSKSTEGFVYAITPAGQEALERGRGDVIDFQPRKARR